MSRLSPHWLWLSALLFAQTFLFLDTNARLQSLDAVTSLRLPGSAGPRVDPTSRTGYEHEQHRLILPAFGTDGYHWIMHAERMLAGEGVRVRTAPAENPPAGRDVHWSGSVRWWLAGVAVAYRLAHPELSLPLAIERVAPWAGTLLLAFFMLLLTPLFAWRFGAAAAALFAFGCVAVYPFYQYSVAGALDHHGLAAMSGLIAVAALAAGGAGWVRNESPATTRKVDALDAAVSGWLPSARHARRWFMVSAVAAGIGLWVSAATIVPILLAIGVSAFVCTGWLASAAARTQGCHVEPQLWRVWGVTGSTISIAFYLLEYFPDHLGMRLEVNHPFYALAWLGAGDLLCRLCQWLPTRSRHASSRDDRPAASLDWRWLLADSALIALLPVVILLTRDSTFTIAHPFLWALHDDYILEFRSLGAEFSSLNSTHVLQGTTNVLPLLLLPLAAWLWQTSFNGNAKRLWRALLIGMIAVALLFLHAFLFPVFVAAAAALHVLPRDAAAASLLVQSLCILPDAAVFWLLFLWPLRSGLPALAPPAQALLLIAILPALLLLALSFWQIRWLGVACALFVAVLCTAAALLSMTRRIFVWTRPRRVVVAFCLFWILVPFPAFTALLTWRFGYPADIDRTQVVARDVAQLLRARLGDRPGVIVSAPTATTWLQYFGGHAGLGTLYWENLAGLQATAAIYGARTEDQARQLIEQHGVTHIVVYSWEPFALEYARLARGQRLSRSNPNAAPADAFILRLLQADAIPNWLTAVPYVMPELGQPAHARVWIFEINDRTIPS